MGRLVAVSTPPSASGWRKGKCKFVVATHRQLSWESPVSRSNELLDGTAHPQTRNRLVAKGLLHSSWIHWLTRDRETQCRRHGRRGKGRLRCQPHYSWNCKYPWVNFVLFVFLCNVAFSILMVSVKMCLLDRFEPCMVLACFQTPLFLWLFCCSSVMSPRYTLNPQIQVLVRFI